MTSAFLFNIGALLGVVAALLTIMLAIGVKVAGNCVARVLQLLGPLHSSAILPIPSSESKS